ncbi:hypothetical protein SAMD00023353_6500070 [Rosellinia necatrix]|uniref:Uncharacterized protein n=1 Tax=Rosellinia necatrix TaxID=77044 RepID=A0A1W2TST8_ROSNE|nr:hypothetical protein SAMD00023353_6500070 [Rosellinia necatrix]
MWVAHRVVVTTNDLRGVPAPVEQNSSHVDERQTAPQVTPPEYWPQMDVKPESKNMSQHVLQHVPQYQTQLVPQYKSEHEPQYQAQYQPQATHVHQSTPAYMPDLYYGNGPAHPPEDGFGMELGISASAGTQAHPAPNDQGEWSYFNPLWEQPRRQI